MFLSFSTLTLILSFFKALRTSFSSFSDWALSSSCAFLPVFALNTSVKSASILAKRIPSFLDSSWEMKGWSIFSGKMTASIFADLNILIYWLCCCSSVT